MTSRRNLLKSMLSALPMGLLPFKAKSQPITFSNFAAAHGLKSGPGIVVTGPNTFVYTNDFSCPPFPSDELIQRIADIAAGTSKENWNQA